MTKLLIEVKYRENTALTPKEAIVEWANNDKVGAALVITKNSSDYGNTDHVTRCPITKIPALAFLYLLEHAEHARYLGTLDQGR